jgi:ABC-type multidrug transport system fused ATPase/permease subunit
LDRADLGRGYSLRILLRMALVGLVAAGLAAWKYDLLNDIYLRDQLTPLGISANGFILLLFAAGVAKMVAILIHYAREERALDRFLGNLEDGLDDPLDGIPERRVIHRRYRTLARLADSHTPINHGALASALVADESTRTSFPKFISNILILTGVFGTILALSIALVGASDMLEASIDSGGMGLVVHGMSTALSTTITAILCYLYFGYFYLKLNDVQTRFLSGIEQTTATWLVPRFETRPEGVMSRFAELLVNIAELVRRMERSQRTFEGIEIGLLEAVGTYRDKVAEVSDDLKRLEGILRAGFRLPDERAP